MRERQGFAWLRRRLLACVPPHVIIKTTSRNCCLFSPGAELRGFQSPLDSFGLFRGCLKPSGTEGSWNSLDFELSRALWAQGEKGKVPDI